jgi:hypothetical protein
VLFLTLESLMTRLARAKHENRLDRALQQLSCHKLPIVDGIGKVKCRAGILGRPKSAVEPVFDDCAATLCAAGRPGFDEQAASIP